MIDSIEIVKLLDTLRENPKSIINERECKKAYDQLILELKKIKDNSCFESVYQKLSYIKIELICMKEFLEMNDEIVNFYLNKAIRILDTNLQIISWKITGLLLKVENRKNESNLEKIQWTGTVSELVELAYSLIESKRINNGQIKIKFFIAQLSGFVNFGINDCFNIYREIRKRKQQTVFLDILKENLMLRMDRADNIR